MSKARWTRVAQFLTVLVALASLAVAALKMKIAARHAPNRVDPALLETMELLDTGEERLRIGAGLALGSITVFPIFAESQQDLGPMVSLQRALAEKTAEVREHGADDDEAEDRATVGKLVLENRGDKPIFVLAGTIVKGGKQDRQIGQDFIVAAHSVASVDAFCVEHGRWDASREGVTTGGKFEAVAQLATAKVRAAGQYKENQGEVWSEVASVNAAHGKQAPSGTLLASVDDGELKKQREQLARRIDTGLRAAQPSAALVGMAYAVHGKVKGVRWFANRDLFAMFQDVLVNSAAMDAISTAPEANAPVVSAKAVVSFVKDVDRAAVEEKDTSADNVNRYRKAEKGWGSSTKLKASPKAHAAPVSKDYLTK